MPKVFAYYDQVKHWESCFDLIHLCAKSWLDRGWDFELLNFRVAERSPLFLELKEAVAKFPTVNHPEYERAAYYRWAALHAVGGGLMIDYDILNYSYDPRELTEPTLLAVGDNCSPPIFVPELMAEKMVQNFIKWKAERVLLIDGKPHLSDIEIIERSGIEFQFKRTNECPLACLDSGWETSSLVHFAKAHLPPHTFEERLELIKKLRPLPLKV